MKPRSGPAVLRLMRGSSLVTRSCVAGFGACCLALTLFAGAEAEAASGVSRFQPCPVPAGAPANGPGVETFSITVPASLRAKLLSATQGTDLDPESLLRPLAREYERAGYTSDDFTDVLQALNTLLERKPELGPRKVVAVGEALLGEGPEDEVLILYVDPTCSTCAALFEKVLPLYVECRLGRRIPLTVRPLVPPHDPSAFAAGIAMRALESLGAEGYFQALSEMIRSADESHLEADPHILASRFGWPGPTLPLDVRAEIARLREEWTYFRARDLHSPLLYFRGRRIAKTRGATFAFEPAFDSTTLLFTLNLIQAVDGARPGDVLKSE